MRFTTTTPVPVGDSRFPALDRTTVTVRNGRLADTARRLAERPPPGEVILDLDGVAFVGSPELGALAVLNRAVRGTGGVLRLVNVRSLIVGVLAASRLSTIVYIHPGGSTVA